MPKAGVIFRTIAGSSRACCAFAIGGFVYEEEERAFFPHAEGRWLPLDGSFVPEYQYKDHLGNLRIGLALETFIGSKGASLLKNIPAMKPRTLSMFGLGDLFAGKSFSGLKLTKTSNLVASEIIEGGEYKIAQQIKGINEGIAIWTKDPVKVVIIDGK